MKIKGLVVHIAGSAGVTNSNGEVVKVDDIIFAHVLVKEIVKKFLSVGARFIVQVGQEPFIDTSRGSISKTFDWTVIETVDSFLAEHGVSNRIPSPLIGVAIQPLQRKIPSSRHSMWQRLVKNGLVRIEYPPSGWHSGALRRKLSSEFGHLLIAIGGGEGVEHLAREYMGLGKPVIPMDLDIGSGSNDGGGGALWLLKRHSDQLNELFRVEAGKSAATMMATIETQGGSEHPEQIAQSLLELVLAIEPPPAFFVRLLDPNATEFPEVETFFRTIVDTFISEIGYKKKEMGTSRREKFWLNEEIFYELDRSALTVVDLTGLRPNCLIELGYALAKGKNFILTSKKGTVLPFDVRMIDCLFWKVDSDFKESMAQLRNYWRRKSSRLDDAPGSET